MSIREELDFGTDLTQSKMGGVNIGYTMEGGKVARGKYQNRFDYLLHRSVISDKQWAAGERLRVDAYRSGKFAYVRSSADHSVRGNEGDYPAEFIAEAKERYKEAMFKMSPDEMKVVNIYVIDDGYLEGSWRAKAKHMVTLRDGLDTLVKHYGI